MSEKAEHRVARERVGAFEEAQLGALVRRVAAELDQYRAGEIDAFESDTALHQYHRGARELWRFCGSGLHIESVDRTIQVNAERGEDVGWWARGEPRRRPG